MHKKNTKENKQKKPIQIFRERSGGVSEKLKKITREQAKNLKKISEIIKNNYKTIPEISQLTGIPSHEVLWYTMAMKKYGKIIEGEEQNGYFKYTLKQEEKNK